MDIQNIKIIIITLLLLAQYLPAACADENEALARLYEKPIPSVKEGSSALSYHEIQIDLKDKRSNEPLLNLNQQKIAGEAFYARRDRLNAPYLSCVCADDAVLKSRKTVVEKLKQVNKRLAPLGVELYVFDAYRPVSCQKALWTYFLNEAKRILGENASEEACIKYAGTYCSNPSKYNPDDFKTWPTHLSGGAIDLSLRRIKTGELLYMGGVFDDASELSHSSFFETSVDSKSSASLNEALRNRRLLYWCMHDAGFANYHNEWWHYDYGNQMWVQSSPQNSEEKAFYGRI